LPITRIGAEFDAIRYLSKFPPEVALVVARNVEMKLAIRWEAEQEEMIRRGDPREVFWMTERDKRNLDHAVAQIPPDIQSDAAAEQYVIRLVANLSPDEAWWVAHRVADFEEAKFVADVKEAKFENSELSSIESKLDAGIPNAAPRDDGRAHRARATWRCRTGRVRS
jgi:hypothetical protein